MDGNSFDLSKTIENAIKEALENRGFVNVLIAGRTGVGKSTLINSVFQGNFAKTGQGKPVTTNTTEYSKPGVPLRIYDSRGLELKEYKQIFSELEAFVKSKNKDTDPQNHIHVAWICIDESSRRIEDGEIQLCQMLSNYMPTIGVITKASFDNGFRKEIQSHLPFAKNVVRVNSIPSVLDDGHIIKVSGLIDLVDITMDVVPEAHKTAFIAAQKVSIQQKKNRAHGIVAAAASAAAAAGASPIPFSDAFILIPIQVGMLAAITAVFGLQLQQSFLSTLVSSTITGAGATIIGRTIAVNLLKMIPGAGSIAGGAISAAIATTVTSAFGEAYIATLSALTSRSDFSTITNVEIIEEFEKRYKNKK